MKPINLNIDATTLIIDTDISKLNVISNKSEEYCSELLERCKYLIDENPNLNYPNFVIINRNNFYCHKCTSYVMCLIFLGIVKHRQNMLSVFNKIGNVDKLL